MRIAPPTLRRARIEIVPMIDTIFFLLVFFMISTLSMVKMEGLGLALPKDTATPRKRPPARIVLAVSPNGDYLVDRWRRSASELPGALRASLQASPDAVVVVNVAPTQKTQTLVSTLDIVDEVLSESGNTNPVLVASPTPKKP